VNFKKLKPSTVAAFRAGQAKIHNRMKLAGVTNAAKLAARVSSTKAPPTTRSLSPNPMARRLMARRPWPTKVPSLRSTAHFLPR